MEIKTTDTTVFEGLHGDDVTQVVFFEQLVDGMHVEVKGSVTDGVFTASVAKIEDDEGDHDGGNGGGNGEHRTEFRGTLESLADTSFVVSGLTINITTDTSYEVNDEMLSAEQFWALAKVGDQVKVKGIKDAEDVITAKKVALEIEQQDNVAEIELTDAGSLVGEVLMVANHKVEFDTHTDFKSTSAELSQAEFLAQGVSWSHFKVIGTLRDDVIFARKIEQKETDEDNKVELSAFIEAFIDNGLTVAGHTIAFGETTEYFNGDHSLTHDEFIAQSALNNKVKIKGALTTDDLIEANVVELKSHD